MARNEYRAKLTADDQRRVAEVANAIGWDGISLTVWLLMQEANGLPVDDALQMTLLAHQAHAHPGFNPTRRADQAGTVYTVTTMPWEHGHPDPIVLPPVPGINDWTVIRYDDPPLPAHRHIIEARTVDDASPPAGPPSPG